MFIKVSKTVYLFIRGTICIHIWPNSWYSYLYSTEYSHPIFGTALVFIKKHSLSILTTIFQVNLG